MSGSYSSLARFDNSTAYIFAWVSRGASELSANDWMGDGYTHALNRTNGRSVAVTTLSLTNKLSSQHKHLLHSAPTATHELPGSRPKSGLTGRMHTLLCLTTTIRWCRGRRLRSQNVSLLLWVVAAFSRELITSLLIRRARVSESPSSRWILMLLAIWSEWAMGGCAGLMLRWGGV
jgi:hypothetical protein